MQRGALILQERGSGGRGTPSVGASVAQKENLCARMTFHERGQGIPDGCGSARRFPPGFRRCGFRGEDQFRDFRFRYGFERAPCIAIYSVQFAACLLRQQSHTVRNIPEHDDFKPFPAFFPLCHT